MDSTSQTTDRYNVATPRYAPQLVTIAFELGVGAVTLLALLATELAWVWRAVAAAGAVAVCGLAVNARFIVCWLSSQWRKVRLYPALLDAARDLESQVASWQGTLALASGLPPLVVEGIYEAEGRLRIVVESAKTAPLRSGENLLVVDTLEKRLVGRARVLSTNARTSEAEVHQPLDALFWGFIRQEIAAYRRQMPGQVAVLRERDVVESQHAFARLMQEVQR